MAIKSRKRLVIDASVLRAAGQSDHPTSHRCRAFLDEVLRICHKAVVSGSAATEWRRHSSRFSLAWQAAMASRGKLMYEDPPPVADLRTAVDALTAAADQVAATKDLHLVEAALAADYVVASLDDRARRVFALVSKDVAALRAVAWANPSLDDRAVLLWLREGALAGTQRRLGDDATNP